MARALCCNFYRWGGACNANLYHRISSVNGAHIPPDARKQGRHRLTAQLHKQLRYKRAGKSNSSHSRCHWMTNNRFLWSLSGILWIENDQSKNPLLMVHCLALQVDLQHLLVLQLRHYWLTQAAASLRVSLCSALRQRLMRYWPLSLCLLDYFGHWCGPLGVCRGVCFVGWVALLTPWRQISHCPCRSCWSFWYPALCNWIEAISKLMCHQVKFQPRALALDEPSAHEEAHRQNRLWAAQNSHFV